MKSLRCSSLPAGYLFCVLSLRVTFRLRQLTLWCIKHFILVHWQGMNDFNCPGNTLSSPAGLPLDSRFQAGQDDGSLRDSSGMLRNKLRTASVKRSVWPCFKSIPSQVKRCLYSHPDLSSSLRLSCYPAFHRSLAGRPVGYFHLLLVPPPEAA